MNFFKTVWRSGTTAKLWTILSAVLLVLVIAVSVCLTQIKFLNNLFDNLFGGPTKVLKAGDPSQYQYYQVDEQCYSKERTLELSNELNETICEEGFVLLKNDDQMLPLYTPESPADFKTAERPEISVFGKNSVNILYGGSGSGGSDTSNAVTLYQSLDSAGYDYNSTLRDFYLGSASGSGRPANPGMNTGALSSLSVGETPWANYTETVKNSFDSYNSAAFVVITRIGGEGFDLTRSESNHYLQLDADETKMLEEVNNAFSNVVLIINSATSIELGFLRDGSFPNIKAAIWIASPGMTGINSLGRILNGQVNPSGRLIDTFARDFSQTPSWQNFGTNLVENGNRYRTGTGTTGTLVTESNPTYVHYEEGIYVGYRYYETRGFIEGGENGDWTWYDEQVAYSFGHGLSYTSFKQEIILDGTTPSGAVGADDTITVKVKVTNTGFISGKETVQLYYTAPYYGSIEKSHVVLGAFAKTPEIPAGGEEFVTLKLKVREMASYRWNVENTEDSGYELEAGVYTVKIMGSANERDKFDSVDYEIAAHRYLYDEVTETRVKNLFEDSNAEMKEEGPNTANSLYEAGYFKKVKVMSRNDFQGTFPSNGAEKARRKTTSYFSDLKWPNDDTSDRPWYVADDDMPVQESKPQKFEQTDVKLYELIGKEYGNSLWDDLLDQITVSEMLQIIGSGAFMTIEIDGIGKPRTIDSDGPSGFNNFVQTTKRVYGTCFYASECVIAATWNVDLAEAMGNMIGNESIWGYTKDVTPYSGWYAPAVNIHRSQFSGRNWEYYSEDPHISGKMAAAVIRGAKSKGVYTFLKHFALNDQETDRNAILTWADEQTMREIYFKPFEYAVKEGGTTAIMSSFNRIGKVWAGGDYRLLTQLLRYEWGFEGMVITDFNTGAAHMPADQMIRAGGDLNLSYDIQPSEKDKSATQISALRRATKNILFTVVNSNAMNGNGLGVRWGYSISIWIKIMVLIDIAIVVGLGVWGFFLIKKILKRTKKDNNILVRA